MKQGLSLKEKRKQRVRRKLRSTGAGRPRLSVFRSGRHIYAQIIHDGEGRTIASASSLEKDVRERLQNGATTEAASEVGKLIAQRAAEQNVVDVVFDRGGYLYHGRVLALAEAAREGGLNF